MSPRRRLFRVCKRKASASSSKQGKNKKQRCEILENAEEMPMAMAAVAMEPVAADPVAPAAEKEVAIAKDTPISWGKKRTSQSKVRHFSLVRDEDEARRAGFIYRKMWVADIPMLKEGEGLLLVRKLKLDEFLFRPIPNLDKDLCDQFISSYDDVAKCGTVNGYRVLLDAPSVSAAVKLPLGDVTDVDAEVPSFITSEMYSKLKRLLMNVNEKTKRGYDLGQVIFGARVEVLSCIASALMTKLESTRECFHYVTPEILLAVDMADRDVKVQWAGRLTQRMDKAVVKCRKSKKGQAFSFGEWLTVIIQQQLQEHAQEALVVVPDVGLLEYPNEGDIRLRNRLEESERETDLLKAEVARLRADSSMTENLRAENEKYGQELAELRAEYEEHARADLSRHEQMMKMVSDKEKNLASLRDENKQQLASLDTKFDHLKQENKQQVASFNTKINFLSQEIDAQHNRLLKETVDRLEFSVRENDSMRAEISRYQQKLTEFEQHTRRHEEMVKTMSEKEQASQNNLARLQNENEQLVTSFNEKMNLLKQEVNTQVDKVEFSQRENISLRGEIRRLNAEVSSFKAETRNFEQDRSRLRLENQQQNRAYQHQLDQVIKMILGKEQELKAREADIFGLRNRVVRQVDFFSDKINHLQQEMEDVNKRLGLVVEAQVEKLGVEKDKASMLEAEIALLRTKKDEQEQLVSNYVKQVEILRADKEEQVENLKGRIVEHELSIENLRTEKDATLGELDELRGKVTSLEAENAGNEKLSASLKTDYDQEAAKLRKLHEEHTKCKRKLENMHVKFAGMWKTQRALQAALEATQKFWSGD